MSSRNTLPRRQLFTAVAAAAAGSVMPVAARAGEKAKEPADGALHKIVYQLNHHEQEHQEAVLNSIGAVLKKYVDDVSVVVVAWGPGIHLLAKNPQRPVSAVHQQRVKSMAQSYGVKFIACGNTMHSLGWTPQDMLDFATVEEVGAAAVMELQEKGYAYIAW